ncbi:MAG: GH92 family glycosyl hydrolase [Acutalibacteraceae bacterium]|nr:GH92 family glycosyl hydrolase [Acutalibacteraceae bacterium]
MSKEKLLEKTFDPTDYADLLFGVGSATSAGPTLPNGSIHPSPETLEKDCGGYTRNQPIVGFGQAYTQGSGGVKCYGNYLLAPMVDEIELDSAKRASYAVKGSEKARCFEYTVELENGITAKVTPAHSAAIYRFFYPEDKTASFLIDVARKLDNDACMKEGYVTIDPENKIIYGGGLYSGNINQIDWNMYFALQFDADFSELGFFKEDKLIFADKEEISTLQADSLKRLGAYVKICSQQVKVKFAFSFVSVEKAKQLLFEQIPDFDYDAVKQSARDKWRKTLSAIELKSDDKALLRRFYTAMYHMNVQPRDRTNDHGVWDDFHTIWDSWKTVFPMYCLIYPHKMSSIIESFVDRARKNETEKNGIVLADQFITAKECPYGQGGNDIENVIVDAFLKEIPLTRYNWQEVYNLLLKSAETMRTKEYIERGFATKNQRTVSGAPYTWRMRPAAATQGFAFNDKAVANMAEKIGTKEEYEKYQARSANWLNVWNEDIESEGFFGFPQTCNEDGSFDEGFDAHGGYNTHFYEATGWDASYINFNDVPRLIEAMGGADTFTKRLLWACEHSVNYYNDDHGQEGYLNFTNEPSFQIPWLFCADGIRRPDLASKVIDGVIKRFSKENDYPGDEDNGGMSSYYIFLMCGIFPYSTTEYYYLHGTRIKEIVFNLSNNKTLRITGENAGDENIYVQSALWNGQPLNDCKLTHKQLSGGGELHFVMGNKPSKWAYKN